MSAKSRTFDENGNEVDSDFYRIMKTVKDSGFKGYVGIEYEGAELSEDEGIKATKALLEKAIAQLQGSDCPRDQTQTGRPVPQECLVFFSKIMSCLLDNM